MCNLRARAVAGSFHRGLHRYGAHNTPAAHGAGLRSPQRDCARWALRRRVELPDFGADDAWWLLTRAHCRRAAERHGGWRHEYTTQPYDRLVQRPTAVRDLPHRDPRAIAPRASAPSSSSSSRLASRSTSTTATVTETPMATCSRSSRARTGSARSGHREMQGADGARKPDDLQEELFREALQVPGVEATFEDPHP